MIVRVQWNLINRSAFLCALAPETGKDELQIDQEMGWTYICAMQILKDLKLDKHASVPNCYTYVRLVNVLSTLTLKLEQIRLKHEASHIYTI